MLYPTIQAKKVMGVHPLAYALAASVLLWVLIFWAIGFNPIAVIAEAFGPSDAALTCQ